MDIGNKYRIYYKILWFYVIVFEIDARNFKNICRENRLKFKLTFIWIDTTLDNLLQLVLIRVESLNMVICHSLTIDKGFYFKTF